MTNEELKELGIGLQSILDVINRALPRGLDAGRAGDAVIAGRYVVNRLLSVEPHATNSFKKEMFDMFIPGK